MTKAEFLQQLGKRRGKSFARKKLVEKERGGGTGGEADTVDIGNGPETPNLRHQN